MTGNDFEIQGRPILCVVGARPNFMKMAALLPELKAEPNPLPVRLIHTGQHYDKAMKHTFFHQLGIPEPDEDLGVGSGTHAEQTAEIMRRFDTVVNQTNPIAVLVVGDVNSTIACALVAAKREIPVIHVEAGLRSFDRTMPEEINRVLTDQISDLLFLTERDAADNLNKEGIPQERIHFVGNVMIDTLYRLRSETESPSAVLKKMNKAADIVDKDYALVTMHRPANVDNPDVLSRILQTLAKISKRIPIIFPIHPRTEKKIQAAGLTETISEANMITLPPIGYKEMLSLMDNARVVLTDSGGIQEETTALGVPCITMRENTERPITVSQGTNTIVGTDPDRIYSAAHQILEGETKSGQIPELWDGLSAKRIASVLKERFG